MGRSEFRKKIINIYIVLSLIIISFSGILIFEELIDNVSVQAQTIIVDINGGGNYTKIQDAINDSNSGDTIYVWDGIYNENIVIDKSISLIGNGSKNTKIIGNNEDSTIIISSDNIKIMGFQISNNGIYYKGHGIELKNRNNCLIFDNNCTNNSFGVSLEGCNSNRIINNSFFKNTGYGVFIYNSNQINTTNNTFTNSKFFGIHSERSKSNSIINNKFISCGLNLFDIDLKIMESHEIMNNFVNNKPLYYFKNLNKKNIPADIGQIYLINCSNINIDNQDISNDTIGIVLVFSNNCSINNNNCSIRLINSERNKISNNYCNTNRSENILIYKSKFNLIEENICYSNQWDSIKILSDSNIVRNNTCLNSHFQDSDTFYSYSSGIYSYGSHNIIQNNICMNNDYGIVIDGPSINNTISNNICNNNSNGGIFLGNNEESTRNDDKKRSKEHSGQPYSLYIGNPCFNTIKNNNCSNNDIGIFLSPEDYGAQLSYNNFSWNICKNNQYGFLFDTSENNTLFENNFIDNQYSCAFIDSDWNLVYHNNFISNKNQINEKGNNFWNNSDQEGNYWSDYTGVDDGSGTGKHAVAGDGIGDTKLPHIGVDNYPLMNMKKWSLPPTPPFLHQPIVFNNKGNFQLHWTDCFYSDENIVQETDNINFETPTTIYQGKLFKFSLNNKENGTYFYRVKSKNDFGESAWSNIVNITIDWPPNIPKNLSTSVYPPGNALNLSWDLNIIDTKNYIIHSNYSGNWSELIEVDSQTNNFDHIGLIDGEMYFYHIQARDHRSQLSNFSEIISGIPWDSIPPESPKGLKIESTTNNASYLIWEHNSEADLEGYNIYRSKISSPESWGQPIISIKSGTNQHIDTELEEQTTYYYVITAFDEVPNESEFSNIASGTTIMSQLGPEINNSVEDFAILEDTIDDSTINLFKWFRDRNNDPLVFKIEGNKNISVYIYQNNGTVILIPKEDWNGQETLTFSASDGVYNISDDVTITVIPVNDPPGPVNIVNPIDGFESTIGIPINFSSKCSDPDLIYGDKLSYIWHSNISDVFGNGQNVSNIRLPVGKHQITVYVTDLADEYSIDSINITILPKSIPDENKTNEIKNNTIPDKLDVNDTNNDTKPGNEKNIFNNALISVIIVLIILAIIITMIYLQVLKKKNKGEIENIETLLENVEIQELIQDSKPPPDEMIEEE